MLAAQQSRAFPPPSAVRRGVVLALLRAGAAPYPDTLADSLSPPPPQSLERTYIMIKPDGIQRNLGEYPNAD